MLVLPWSTKSSVEITFRKQHIHFADNDSIDTNSNYMTSKTLEQFYFFHTYDSINVKMVPYTSKNGSKQTIGTRNIRYGYNNFAMNHNV